MFNLFNYLSKLHFESLNEEGKFENLFFASVFVETLVKQLPKCHGAGLQNTFIEIKGDYLKWIPDVNALDKTAMHYLNTLKTNQKHVEKTQKNLLIAINKVNSFSRELLSIDFYKKTNIELTKLCETYYALAQDMIAWGFFPVIIEIHEPLYTRFLTQLLEEKNKQLNAGVSVPEAVAVLSSFSGETEAKREQVELLKLALKVKKIENIAKFYNKELKKHAEKYGWLAYGFGGPAWREKEFTDSLIALLADNSAAKLAQLEKSELELREKITYFEEKLKLTPEEKRFFAIARDFMKGKALRKEAMSFAAYASEPLHREIAKRLNLSFLQVRFMLLPEVKQALLQGIFNESELLARTKHVVFGAFDNGKRMVIATGKEADTFVALAKQPEVREIHELTGTCACPGKATGEVKIINRPSDMSKMQKGDVLVSYATTPDIVPAMRLASAIITDLGGLTCHAAIVSRELNLPCVIGAKIATKWLKDRDKVEVDATNGVVKKL